MCSGPDWTLGCGTRRRAATSAGTAGRLRLRRGRPGGAQPERGGPGGDRHRARRFEELGSARQVVLSLRADGLPAPPHAGLPDDRWAEATYPAVHDFITNPAYGGAFVYGRTKKWVSRRAGRIVARGLGASPRRVGGPHSRSPPGLRVMGNLSVQSGQAAANGSAGARRARRRGS